MCKKTIAVYLLLRAFESLSIALAASKNCVSSFVSSKRARWSSSSSSGTARLMRLNPDDVFRRVTGVGWYPKSLSTNARSSSSVTRMGSSQIRASHRCSMIFTSRSSSSSVGALVCASGSAGTIVCGLLCTIAS